jgi:hypothetical protein
MGEAGGGLLGNMTERTLHGDTGQTSPPAFAAPYLHGLSRSLFVFCFERDPHGLSHPFQTAKLLQKVQCRFLERKVPRDFRDIKKNWLLEIE